MKKNFSLLLFLVLTIGLLSGCSISTEPITAATATGLWDKLFVLPLANFITFLYNILNNNLGLSIILATAIVRLVLIPLYLKSINHGDARNSARDGENEKEIRT